MWARLKLNIEILGYNRAIGRMKSQAGVTQNMIDWLITERNKVEDCLVALKKEQREARFGRTLTA